MSGRRRRRGSPHFEAWLEDDVVIRRRALDQRLHAAREVPIPVGQGGHGGGDGQLLSDVFDGTSPDPLRHRASWFDGVCSVAVGLAGNRSLETGRAIPVAELDLGRAARALARSATLAT